MAHIIGSPVVRWASGLPNPVASVPFLHSSLGFALLLGPISSSACEENSCNSRLQPVEKESLPEFFQKQIMADSNLYLKSLFTPSSWSHGHLARDNLSQSFLQLVWPRDHFLANGK